jgi:hypothetical protein
MKGRTRSSSNRSVAAGFVTIPDRPPPENTSHRKRHSRAVRVWWVPVSEVLRMLQAKLGDCLFARMTGNGVESSRLVWETRRVEFAVFTT